MKYSDVAIETALTLRLIFNLPLRQAEGFLHSLFRLMGIDLSAPDHTTLSRRGQHLDLALRRVPAGEGTHLIVDSTGLSIVGEGEWTAAKHGRCGKRGWKKLHLCVDRSGVIVAQTLTERHVDDATTANTLIDAVEGDVASVTADAAYDSLAPPTPGGSGIGASGWVTRGTWMNYSSRCRAALVHESLWPEGPGSDIRLNVEGKRIRRLL